MTKNNQSGQTLVALLFFVMIGIIATTSATIILFTNLKSEAFFQEAESARSLSELGIEKALISLLRDPSYQGETINIDGNSVLVSVTGGTTKTIESISTIDSFSRKIQVTVSFNNNTLTTNTWKEIY